jgi:hypothetical protein
MWPWRSGSDFRFRAYINVLAITCAKSLLPRIFGLLLRLRPLPLPEQSIGLWRAFVFGTLLGPCISGSWPIPQPIKMVSFQ